MLCRVTAVFCGDYRFSNTDGKESYGLSSPSTGGVVYQIEFSERSSYTFSTCSSYTNYDSYLSLYEDAELTTRVDQNDDSRTF